jgi:AmmeMemoRadiSam system protein A
MMVDDADRISLRPEERAELLSLARRGLVFAAGGGQDAESVLRGVTVDHEALNQTWGVFVTLKQGGSLRGCIGTIEAREPLFRAVVECAISSAVRDPRFPPVTGEEVEDISIEISVMSPLRSVWEPQEIVVGIHGLYVRRGMNAGLLLPQVATEYGWDRREFLEQCCRKAGLPSGAWQEEGTEIMIFSALVFGEVRND